MNYAPWEEEMFTAVQQIKNGNQEAYNTVYNLSDGYTYKLVHDLTQDDEATTVIIGQVYQDIWANIYALDNPELFYSWAGQIATTDTVNYLRSAGRLMIDDEATEVMSAENEEYVAEYFADDRETFIPGSILEDAERQRLLRDYVENLPLADKIIVQYYYYEGMPVYYIAQMLGYDSYAVRKSIRKIKKKLRNILTPDGEETGTQLYDMTAIPILWLVFKSAVTNIPVAAICGGAAITAGVAGSGAVVGSGAVASGAGAAAGGAGAAAGGAGAAAGGAGAAAGGAGVATSGAGMATSGAGMVASGAGVAKVGVGLGIKVAVAVATTALVGTGVAAFTRWELDKSDKNSVSTEITAETTTDDVNEEITESTTEATEEPTTEITTEAITEAEVDLNEESHKAYQKFMDGEITAIVMDNGEFSDDEYSTLKPGEEISLGELDERFMLETDQRKRYYAYGDFVCDGVDELVIRYSTEDSSGDNSLYEAYDWTLDNDGVYLKYMDEQVWIFTTGSWGYNLPVEVQVDSVGRKYKFINVEIILIEYIFDTDCTAHEIYCIVPYFYCREANPAIDTVLDSMVSEFGFEFELDKYVEAVVIDGEYYYTDRSEIDDDVLNDPELTRYNELLAENNVKMYSREEIDELIKAEEEKYVPGGIPDDAPDIEWVEF